MGMQCQLWMGSLEPNMTESFIMAAFHRMTQRPLAVKVMRNKFTGEPAGYAFVHFQFFASPVKLTFGGGYINSYPPKAQANFAYVLSSAHCPSTRTFNYSLGSLNPVPISMSSLSCNLGLPQVPLKDIGQTDVVQTTVAQIETDEEAIDAMHKLNGKPIPGTFPVIRFRLNTASREARATMQQEREFSVWVGDLSPDVDDYSLYRVFASKYSSIKTAKVILDTAGYTKGYGFVRFGSEDEQRNALYAMNGYTGLGNKPLKICTAVPKPKSAITTQAATTTTTTNASYSSGTEYSNYYDPSAYWQNYSAWSGYYGQDQNAAAAAAPAPDAAQAVAVKTQNDDLALVEHKKTIDVDQMNQEFLDTDLCLWDALESSQWFHNDIIEAHC